MASRVFLLAVVCVGGSFAALPTFGPIEHASVLLSYAISATTFVYADPVDAKGRGLFDNLPKADVIVITHSHSDHLQPSTVKFLLRNDSSTKIIGPPDVVGILKAAGVPSSAMTILTNNQSHVVNVRRTSLSLNVSAVPMYNTGPNPHHPEGKWNGYVLAADGDLVYLSGDTSFIPPMRDNFGFRKRFGHAFLCMNLPYTMSVDEAANATAALVPDVITPYHYRNADGTLSNLTDFKDLVAQRAPSVDVDILNFYPYGPLTQITQRR